MTPKEKAKELVDKMYDSHGQYADIGFYEAVICAQIAVDEILNVIPNNNGWQTKKEYWQEVKQEIENL